MGNDSERESFFQFHTFSSISDPSLTKGEVLHISQAHNVALNISVYLSYKILHVIQLE